MQCISLFSNSCGLWLVLPDTANGSVTDHTAVNIVRTDRHLSRVVTQAYNLVGDNTRTCSRLQEIGLGVHLPASRYRVLTLATFQFVDMFIITSMHKMEEQSSALQKYISMNC